jgi:16S rRNA G966 N2-methylase RsmD
MIRAAACNVLYYGDNLDILRRYLPAAAVDLVYLDPPGHDAELLAFEGTWHSSAETTYASLTN